MVNSPHSSDWDFQKRNPTITKTSVKPKSIYDMPSSPFSSSRYQHASQLTQLSSPTTPPDTSIRQFTSSGVPASPHGKRTPRTPSSRSPSPSTNLYIMQHQQLQHPAPIQQQAQQSGKMFIHNAGLSVNPRQSPRQNNYMYSPSSSTSSRDSDGSPNTPPTPRTPQTPRGTLPPLSSKKTRSPNTPTFEDSRRERRNSAKENQYERASPSSPTPQQQQQQQHQIQTVQQQQTTITTTTTNSQQQPQPPTSSRSRSRESRDSDSDSSNGGSTPSTPTSRARRKSIKNYKKGDLIGQGANGRVYMSFDADNCQFFAVKEVTFASVPSNILEERLNALQREINLMKSLSHPNIVQYFGAAKSGPTLDIFLEYVPGGSIASLIKRFGRLSDDIVKQFTKQIVIGLLYLHENRIVHRDIKGANILINVEGIIKLADFGASKRIHDIMTLSTDFKSLIGTPNFMAPEVITQEGHGRPADIWSVGCTVLEMYTGKPPFSECTTAAAVMFKIASTTEPPMYSDCIPPDAKDFLSLCFERDQNKRPTAMALLQHPWLKEVEVPIHGKGPSPRSPKNRLNSPIASPSSPRTKRETVTVQSPSNHTSLTDPNDLPEDLRPLPSANPVLPTQPKRKRTKPSLDHDFMPDRQISATPDLVSNQFRSKTTYNMSKEPSESTIDPLDDMQPLKNQRKDKPQVNLVQEAKEGFDSTKSISKFLKSMSEWQSRSCKDMKYMVQMAKKKSQESNSDNEEIPDDTLPLKVRPRSSPKANGSYYVADRKNTVPKSASPKLNSSKRKKRATVLQVPTYEIDEDFPVRSGKESPRDNRFSPH